QHGGLEVRGEGGVQRRAVELAALGARRVARERDDAVELALHRERVLDVALAYFGQRDVALDEVDEPAVEVLHALLEGERVAAVRAVADDRDRAVLHEQRRDRRAQPGGAARQQHDAAGEGLLVEVVAVLGVAARLLGVEMSGRHGRQSSKRAPSEPGSSAASDSTTRWADW